MTHTVEKIGGTSMSRAHELKDTLFRKNGEVVYNRAFVVSAFGGITNLLLEHKKSGEPGVYRLFADSDEQDDAWEAGLDRVAEAMRKAHRVILSHDDDIAEADAFVAERIDGAKSLLHDLKRLCTYGQFQLSEHLMTIREMLSGLGESHSAMATALMLRRDGVNARAVDLSGWRDDSVLTLEERLSNAWQDVDVAQEMPIVTGYCQCSTGLMKEYDRGYSEVTFAHLAALSGADEAIIHKEFHLSSADPNLVGLDKVRVLGTTNYDVADQLSNLGMEAIHPNAAKVLRQSGVALRVDNCFDQDNPGTVIDQRKPDTPRVEMVTGLSVYALELFEQDMVGEKGYDATILGVLDRHKLWIVSKNSNANTITHYLRGSLSQVKRAEEDLRKAYPDAGIVTEGLAMVAAVGRDLDGLRVISRGLIALEEAGIPVKSVFQSGRNVDAQFIVAREHLDDGIRALHKALIEEEETEMRKAG
ncbi:aspartate kinase [Paracoccaceae bacterium GXU_MW_L88]